MNTIDSAIASLKTIISAAESRDPAAVAAVLAAAAANDLKGAVRLVLPEIRHSISAGDGRFTHDQVLHLERALETARGVAQAA